MNPGEAIVILTMFVTGASTLIALTAIVLKHRQKMAGAAGKDGNLRQTVQMLTETLERQHDRQQEVLRRLDALEAAREPARLDLPDAPEALPEAPARARTRV